METSNKITLKGYAYPIYRILGTMMFVAPPLAILTSENLDKINTIAHFVLLGIGALLYVFFFVEMFIKVNFGRYHLYHIGKTLYIKEGLLIPFTTKVNCDTISSITYKKHEFYIYLTDKPPVNIQVKDAVKTKEVINSFFNKSF